MGFHAIAPLDPGLKSRPPKTSMAPISITTSGRRYYESGLGRWISRDPLEEMDGCNVLLFAGNDSIDGIDAFGLFVASTPPGRLGIYLDTPADAPKCPKVQNIISFYAAASGQYNDWMWQRYLARDNTTEVVPFDWFDRGPNSTRDRQERIIKLRAIAALVSAYVPCNTEKTVIDEHFNRWQMNLLPSAWMLLQWTFEVNQKVTVGKKCKWFCCIKRYVKAEWKFTAHDDIDFSGGRVGWTYPPYYITDRLVSACNLGVGYHIQAEESGSWSASVPCFGLDISAFGE